MIHFKVMAPTYTYDQEVVGNQKVEREDVRIPENDECGSHDPCDKTYVYKAKPTKKSGAPVWKAADLPLYILFQGNINLPSFINKLEIPADILIVFTNDLITFMVERSNLVAFQVDINWPDNIT